MLQPHSCFSLKSVSGMYEIPEVNSIPHLKGQVYQEISCDLFLSLHVSFK